MLPLLCHNLGHQHFRPAGAPSSRKIILTFWNCYKFALFLFFSFSVCPTEPVTISDPVLFQDRWILCSSETSIACLRGSRKAKCSVRYFSKSNSETFFFSFSSSSFFPPSFSSCSLSKKYNGCQSHWDRQKKEGLEPEEEGNNFSKVASFFSWREIYKKVLLLSRNRDR